MSIAIRAEGSGKRVGRWQVSLADLSLLVLAAGLAAGVVREARDIWVESARASGVGVEVVAVILALVLVRSILGLARRRPRGGGVTMAGCLASMAWRALAVVLLICFVLQESEILRIDLATRMRIDVATRRSSFVGGVGASGYDVREKLIPICAILAMFGIVVGMGAGVGLARPEPRRPRPYWLFVPLAALAGVLFVAVPATHALVPLYILNVLELVDNAMRPLGRVTSTSLSARLLLAGMEAVPAALAIVGLALIVARDFQRAGRSMPWATTRGGWFVRLLSLAAAGAAGIGMALVAIPTMSPHLRDGIRGVLDPEAIVIVFIGFGTFAAGLAARTVVPRPAWEKPRWLRRLANVLPLGLMGIVVSSALKCLPSSMAIDPALPPMFAELLDGIDQAGVWFWGIFPAPLADGVQAWLDPGRLFWILTMVGLALFLSELALRPPALRIPPFDLVGCSPGRLVRFAWLTLSLTVVCLAALPTLIVLGQVILHLRLGIITWTASGWPSPF
jgi:branched-subunit amino acid transport protein AzlD